MNNNSTQSNVFRLNLIQLTAPTWRICEKNSIVSHVSETNDLRNFCMINNIDQL